MDAELIDDRNKVCDDASYAALAQAVRASDGVITVFVLFAEVSPTAPPFAEGDDVDAVARATPAKVDEASSARSSALQTDFHNACLARDGMSCVLCVDGDGNIAEDGVAGAEVDAAHILPRDSKTAVMNAVDLLTSWDPRNGIVLCKRCHLAFDHGLWHVDAAGAAVVADAAKSDPQVGRYWRARDGRLLRRPTMDFQLKSFPTEKVWAATLAKFDAAREQRHRLAAEYEYRCGQCSKCYQRYSALEKHVGSPACTAAMQSGRRLCLTPDGK